MVRDGETEPGDEQEEAARRLLTAEADSLIDEIRGSVNFYLGQSGEPALERIVVAGNGARLPHLAARLGRDLDTPIEAAKVLERVDVGRVHLTEAELLDAQPVLPTSVGLALWGTI